LGLGEQISQSVADQDPVVVSTTLFNTTSYLLNRALVAALPINVITGSLQVSS
jgi:hypothetical protein